MLTRLEISGFKSFTDFEVDFAPLTVIAGANASGKSNLIEALRLVQGLATRGSFGAGLEHQGNLKDLFTKYDNSVNATVIKLGVEVSLPLNYLPGFEDKFLDYTDFRYEVEITNHIDDLEGAWYEISKERLITTQHKDALPFINYGYDAKQGKRYEFGKVHHNLTWTTLSEASPASDIHTYACQTALRTIILADLIKPANFSDRDQPNQGNGLPDPQDILPSLVRFKKAGKEHLHYLSQRLRKVVTDLVAVDVYTDDYNRSTVTATDTEGRSFLATNLSEGTLRIIALASYLLKRKTDQVLLIEEPENGIDPRRVQEMLALLVDLSAGHDSSQGDKWQVICTTHSPILLQAALNLKSPENVSVLLTNKVSYLTTLNGERRKLKVTRMNAIPSRLRHKSDASALELYTLREAAEYLSPLMLQEISENA
jgi:AAA15 family ATPase/GTPase